MIERVNDGANFTSPTGDGKEAPVVIAHLQPTLLTKGDGATTRLRVDVAQTGFFDGREFRTFRRLNIAAGAGLVVRAVVPVNTILFDLRLEMVDGWADIETVIGGTPGGTWSETLPVIPRNLMTTAPAYTAQNVLTAGGTHTGGTVIDVLAARAAGATAQASSVGMGLTSERGIAPGTYYFRLTNPGSGSAVGKLSAWWEERP